MPEEYLHLSDHVRLQAHEGAALSAPRRGGAAATERRPIAVERSLKSSHHAKILGSSGTARAYRLRAIVYRVR